jgi:CheY-like chemotaxis protein
MMIPLVAIISDSEASIPPLSALIATEGYHALWCGAHERAYPVIATQQPDLVLLDLPPERLDAGLLLLNRLRLSVDTLQLPVIVCANTQLFSPQALALLRGAGCEVLPTPYDPGDLLLAIAQCLPTRERAVGA